MVVTLVFIRLSTGAYVHDEFGGTHFFIKHRPIWKWRFYSPRGMSDLTLEEMGEERRREQLLFDEFVLEQGMSR